MPLLHRVAGINAALVVVAVTVTILVLAPGKVSALALDEELAVVAAVAVVVLANLYLLRRIVSPLQALTRFARSVDLDPPAGPDARTPRRRRKPANWR